jgi:TonB family protein
LKALTKRLLAGLILTLSSLAYGDDSSPEFDRYVSPTFPSGLGGGRLTGEVKVSYRIHHDGSVSDIKVLSKTDRKFSRAVVYAVGRWRFMPWDISYRKPAAVRESVEYLFGMDRVEQRLRMTMLRQGE